MVELIFDGGSLFPFESSLECDLGGKNEVVDDDLGSPTPKKASLLETASPTAWQVDSARPPLPPSEVEWVRFWMEGRDVSSLADGRRSEGTTVGVIGRVSWDLRPGIILVYLVIPDVRNTGMVGCRHLVRDGGCLTYLAVA